MTSHWKIAPGRYGKYWPEQRDAKVIAVGWDMEYSLNRYRQNGSGKAKFEKDFKKIFKYKNKKTKKWKYKDPAQLWDFYTKIKKGHKIIAGGGKYIWGIGTVGDKGYGYEKNWGILVEYPNYYPVKWKYTFWSPINIEKLGLKTEIADSFKGRTAVKPLTKEEFKTINEAVAKKDWPFKCSKIKKTKLVLNKEPTTEKEVILLFSAMMCNDFFDITIDEFGDRFPDALVCKKERKRYIRKLAEFELNASGFISHHKKFIKERKPCDMVICWKDDIKEKMKNLKERDTRKSKKEFGKWKDILRRINSGKLEVLELRKELKNQIQSRR